MGNEASHAGVPPAAATTGAPANAPTGQPGAPAPQPNTPTQPTELEIELAPGKKLRVPTERVPEYVKAGMRVTEEMARVNARAKDIRAFDSFMAARASNPLLDEAVRIAVANPGLIIQQARNAPAPIQPNGAPPAGGDEPDDAPPPAGAPNGAPNAEVAALKSEIGQLTEAVRGLLGERAAAQVDIALEREIARHPWVKGNEAAAEAVRRHVETSIQLAHATKQPAKSVAELVFEEAANQQRLIQETDQRRLQEAEERKRLRTTDPARAASMLTPPPKLTGKSFEDGTLRKAVTQRLKEFFG